MKPYNPTQPLKSFNSTLERFSILGITAMISFSLIVGGFLALDVSAQDTASVIDKPAEVETVETIDNGDESQSIPYTDCFSGESEQFSYEPNTYLARYFDESVSSTEPVCAQVLDQMSIDRSIASRIGVASEDLRVTYTGEVTFDQRTLRNISVYTVFAESKPVIIITDPSGNQERFGHERGSISYIFEPGMSRVYAEYSNNWAFPIFDVRLEEPEEDSVIKDLVSYQLEESTNIYYAGVYESDFATGVSLSSSDIDTDTDTTRPYILFLSSYERVDWNLDATLLGAQAIVINSYYPDSSVNFGDQSFEGDIFVLNRSEYIDTAYSLEPSCTTFPDSNYVYCSREQIFEVYPALMNIFGQRNFFHSGAYDTNELSLPGELVTQESIDQLYNEVYGIEDEADESDQDDTEEEDDGQEDGNEDDDCIISGGDILCGGEGEDTIILEDGTVIIS